MGRFGGLRLWALVVNVVLLGLVLLADIWGPKGDFANLYSGVEIVNRFPLLWLLPGLNILMILLLAVRRLYGNRVVRVVVAGLSVGYVVALFWLNEAFMNTAENAPAPHDVVLGSVAILPLLLAALAIAAAAKGDKPVVKA